MYKTETRTIEEEYVKDVICNMCGESCRDRMDMNFECATLSASWGYCSRKDTERHHSHLCEDCYDKLVEQFKIPPTEVEF